MTGRRGSTRAWRERVRRPVLDRDHHQCQLRLDGCTGIATQAHHVAGHGTGDDPDHVVAACASCNLKVGDPRRYNPPPRPATRW